MDCGSRIASIGASLYKYSTLLVYRNDDEFNPHAFASFRADLILGIRTVLDFRFGRESSTL